MRECRPGGPWVLRRWAEGVGPHIAASFEGWPDLRFDTRRLYVRDGLVVQEQTAHPTHTRRRSRGDLVAEPSGNALSWVGMDVIRCEGGLVKRKDVCSDSVGILRQVGPF